MKNIFTSTVLLALALLVVVPANGQERKIGGQGEEYHHAMYLNFRHSADEAMALTMQLMMPRELNVEIARQHVNEIVLNLDNARIQHAMVHKSYQSGQDKLIMENHETLLQAHNTAIEAAKALKAELAKKSPDKETLSTQARVVFEQCQKAAREHEDGMKKLGIVEMKAPS